MNTLEIDSIELAFDGRKILSNIYLQCKTGEVIGLLGRNGSGKSSLMKVAFGSMTATHHSVRINNTSLSGNQINQRVIAYLPQEGLIPPFLSIRKAIRTYGLKEVEIVEQFPEIQQFINLYPREISGGYLRIIEALLVLGSDHPFCILDEPFTGLMPLHIDKMLQLITEAKQGKGIIITDHLYRHVLSVADHLYLLNNGQTYKIKNTEELVSRGYINTL
jgi:ABC-type multidrug transport system ATPase subunit